MVRVTREVPCPKEAALKMLLDENEETGRIVVFAGFTGSVDRVVNLCLKEKWDVVRCDQGDVPGLHARRSRRRRRRRRAAGLLGEHGPPAGGLCGEPRVGRHEPDVGGGPHGGVLVQLVGSRSTASSRKTASIARAWT